MERNSLKQFHNQVTWSTRIYTLLAIVLTVAAFLFNAWTTNWGLTIVVALSVILLVESIALSVQHHPKTWRAVAWICLLILLALLLMGAFLPFL